MCSVVEVRGYILYDTSSNVEVTSITVLYRMYSLQPFYSLRL